MTTPPAGAQALADRLERMECNRHEDADECAMADCDQLANLERELVDELPRILTYLRALADMRGALTGLLQAVLEPVGEIERVKAAAVANDGKVPGRAAITLYATVEEYEAAMQRARQALARSAP